MGGHGRLGIRLTAALLLLLVVLFSGTAVLVLHSRRSTLERELDLQATGLANSAAAATVEPLLIGDYPVLQEFLGELVSLEPDVLEARVVREDGEVVAHSGSRSQHEHEAVESSYSISSPIAIDGKHLGDVEIEVSTSRVERQIHRDVSDGSVLFGVVGLAVVLFAHVFLRRTLREPLESLERQARTLGEGDLDTSIALDSNDELGLLARTMEVMRGRLKASLEELHAHNRELERLNRAKTALLANTSHEIRTPITALLGFAELLEQEKLDTDEVRQHARTMRVNAENLLALLNDVLDLAKIEAGELEVQRRPCDAWSVAQEVVEVQRSEARRKDIALELVADAKQPARIETDPTRLRQILIQLVGNALKFTDGGRVTVRFLAPEREADGDHVVIAVEDTGIGIEPSERAHLFERFHQVDASNARRYGGSGLGLSVASEIATLLGGSIEVASEPGRGSTFTLRVAAGSLAGMPFHDPHQVAASAAEGGVVGNGRVLVVEDVPTNRMLLSRALRSAGFDVSTADNGREGVDAVLTAKEEGRPFDLVLMDIQMPVMDGYDATRAIRDAGLGVPIVALTAHAMRGDQARCLDAGCDEYATKPIGREQLVALARKHVHRGIAS